jgi:hypothetical protein
MEETSQDKAKYLIEKATSSWSRPSDEKKEFVLHVVAAYPDLKRLVEGIKNRDLTRPELRAILVDATDHLDKAYALHWGDVHHQVYEFVEKEWGVDFKDKARVGFRKQIKKW